MVKSLPKGAGVVSILAALLTLVKILGRTIFGRKVQPPRADIEEAVVILGLLVAVLSGIAAWSTTRG